MTFRLVLIASLLLGFIVNMAVAQQDKSLTADELKLYGDDKVAEEALAEVDALSESIQNLKKDVVVLNKDLRILEEKLLFPSSTKYSFFVSVNSGEFFTLESIKLKINGRLVTTHLYSPENREALERGGVQKLFVTNLSEGPYTATAFFTGLGPNGRPFKRASELKFTKKSGEGYMEIAINDDGAILEPVFELKQW